jgi:eukaryotic-like serine/threonine-protein kinase
VGAIVRSQRLTPVPGHSGTADALDGETLDRRLQRLGRLPTVDALRIAGQLASILAAAHTRGAVHRALSPRNVFLARDVEGDGGDRVQLVDTMPGGDPVTSSPLYMSPEQCRGTSEIDRRSDIYALGCLLYHLLVGRPPFVGDAHAEVLAMHLYEAPAPPSVVLPFLSAALDGMVMRCIAKSPAERFAHMSDVAAEIDRLLAIDTISTPPAGIDLAAISGRWAAASIVTTLPAARPTRVRRWGALLAAAAVAITSAALLALTRWF